MPLPWAASAASAICSASSSSGSFLIGLRSISRFSVWPSSSSMTMNRRPSDSPSSWIDQGSWPPTTRLACVPAARRPFSSTSLMIAMVEIGTVDGWRW
jgi:hypothetical protein